MRCGEVFSQPEHRPPPLKKVARTDDQLKRIVDRLVIPPRPPNLPDAVKLSPRVVKSKEEIAQGVDRLYDKAVASHKLKQQQLAESQEKAISSLQQKAVLSEEQVAESVERMHTKALLVRKAANEQLQKRYLFDSKKSPRIKLNETNERVYTKARERHQAATDALYEKYIVTTTPRSRKLTADEEKCCAERLTTTVKK